MKMHKQFARNQPNLLQNAYIQSISQAYSQGVTIKKVYT